MEYVIEAKNVGKRYDIYPHPFDRVKELLFFGRKRFHTELWALKDISFNVRRGEAFGFIGSNGAGKSTLLKLISGISKPTEGTISVKGRVSALMELGAGFHHEFTGRDNIYMNCSILGMTKEEIEEKIDKIIEFSELGDFIDRPIKIYSTGMFMRLGFSVAINTDPEILLIDEILAVGDEYFQSKCYKKIKEFREQGKTVIFVSHSINTVRGLCDRVMWLDNGKMREIGDSVRVTEDYLNFQRARIGRKLGGVVQDKSGEIPKITRQGTREAEITKVEFLNEREVPKEEFEFNETLIVRIYFKAHEDIETPNMGVSIWRNDGVLCYGSSSAKDETSLDVLKSGEEGYLDVIFPECPLMAGEYEVSVAIYCPKDLHPYDFHNRLYKLKVKSGRRDEGVCYIPHKYKYVFKNGKIIEKEAKKFPSYLPNSSKK